MEVGAVQITIADKFDRLHSRHLPTGCEVVPVLHGPRVAGQSVEIHDADNDRVILRAPMQDMDQQWEFWRFSISASVKRIQIVARDEGEEWGEWLAIADARACR